MLRRAVSAKAAGHSELESVTHKLDIPASKLTADMNVPGVSISVIQDDAMIKIHSGS